MQRIVEGFDGTTHLALVEEGGVVKIEKLDESLFKSISSGVIGFAKANPFLTAIAGVAAVDAVKKYNANKRLVKFQAKDRTERKTMQAVVDMMTKSGYRVVKQKHVGASGYEWELSKKW